MGIIVEKDTAALSMMNSADSGHKNTVDKGEILSLAKRLSLNTDDHIRLNNLQDFLSMIIDYCTQTVDKGYNVRQCEQIIGLATMCKKNINYGGNKPAVIAYLNSTSYFSEMQDTKYGPMPKCIADFLYIIGTLRITREVKETPFTTVVDEALKANEIDQSIADNLQSMDISDQRCPITQNQLYEISDPVVIRGGGAAIYEREDLLMAHSSNPICPVSRAPFTVENIVSIKELINRSNSFHERLIAILQNLDEFIRTQQKDLHKTEMKPEPWVFAIAPRPDRCMGG